MRKFFKISGIALIAVVVVIIIAAVAGGPGSHQSSSTSANDSAAAAPAAVTSPSASPTPAPFQPQTLLDYSGTGQEATPRFTVGGSGDYTVSWTFSGNTDPEFGGASNFIIEEDGSNDFNFDGPDLIQASGSGSTNVSGDTGTHTFNVQASGSWTIKVVTAP